MSKVSDVLGGGKGRWAKIGEFSGQRLEIKGYDTRDGQFGTFCIIEAEDADGQTHLISNGGVVARQVAELADAGLLPANVRVQEYDTRYNSVAHKLVGEEVDW
jgi:hypothetical protein